MIIRINRSGKKHIHIGDFTTTANGVSDDVLDINIGKGKSNGKKISFNYSVDIWDNEGKHPHMHITGPDNDHHNKKFGITSDIFDSCVMIFDNRYFDHGAHKSKFSDSRSCKDFDAWLSMPNAYMRKLTNWEYCVYAWKYYKMAETGFPDTNGNDNTPKPNYRYIKDYDEA